MKVRKIRWDQEREIHTGRLCEDGGGSRAGGESEERNGLYFTSLEALGRL